MNRTLFSLTTFLIILLTPLFSAGAAIDWNMPVIESIAIPDTKALNNGPIRLTIFGNRFNPATTVKLTKEGAPDINATDLVIAKKIIFCTFNLLDQPIGKWNLLVTNTWDYGRKKRTAIFKNALIVDFAGPKIDAFFPKDIDSQNASLIQAKICGAYFRDGVKVKLVGPSGQIIPGIQIKLLEDTQINCTFNLTGQSIGSYELIVTNVDGKSASFQKCFRIKEADPNPFLDKKIKTVQRQPKINEAKPEEPKTPSTIDTTPAPTINQASTPTPSPVSQSEEKPTSEVLNTVSNPKLSVEPFAEVNQKLRPIFFDVNQFNIRDSELPSLENNLILLKENPGLVIVICGYADERGTNIYNFKLSKKRAVAVRQFLTTNGITAKIIVFSFGKGASNRIEHTENQWQQNRRAEISLWEKQPTKQQVVASKL